MTLASPTLAAEFRPLRFALRELRGGLHGFRIFVACIALGVMAIAGSARSREASPMGWPAKAASSWAAIWPSR